MEASTAAHHAVRLAVARGALPPVDTLTCAECGGGAQVYHHWLGYAREQRLEVQALCFGCHKQKHRRPAASSAASSRRPRAQPKHDEEIVLDAAARRYGVVKRTLQAAATSGQLDARRAYGRWWVTTPAAVERWLKQAKHRPGPAPRRTG